MTATNEDYKAIERLLAKLARRSWRRLQAIGVRVDFEDVLQEACISFMLCSERFDAEQGVKFSTYLYRAVSNNLSRMEGKMRDQMLNLSSLDANVGYDTDMTLHEVLPDETSEPADDRLERMERIRKVLGKLTPDTRKVIELMETPGPELSAEIRRKSAFSDHCRLHGYAAPNVKLNTSFICDAMGWKQHRTRKVKREIDGLEKMIALEEQA